MNVDNLLENSERYKLSEKQKQQLQKIDGMRRKLKSMLDKKYGLQKAEDTEFDERKVRGQIENTDKKSE